MSFTSDAMIIPWGSLAQILAGLSMSASLYWFGFIAGRDAGRKDKPT